MLTEDGIVVVLTAGPKGADVRYTDGTLGHIPRTDVSLALEVNDGEIAAMTESLRPRWDGLDEDVKDQALFKLSVVQEVLTGYCEGHAALAREGEPRAPFGPNSTMSESRRCRHMAELLTVEAQHARRHERHPQKGRPDSLGYSVSTIRLWVREFRRNGLLALIDGRRIRKKRGWDLIDERFRALALQEADMLDGDRSTISQNELDRRVRVALKEAGAQDVVTPERITRQYLSALMHERGSTTRAQKSRVLRSVSGTQEYPAYKPGQVVAIDATRADNLVYDPLSGAPYSVEILAAICVATRVLLRAETADRFTARALGVANAGALIDEERELDPVSRLTTAVALAEWITFHANVIEVGPGEYALPPAWTQTEIGGRTYRHPQCLRVHFPAGTILADTGCVIAIDARRAGMGSPQLSAYVAPNHQDGARLALDRLTERAEDLNPYRGRALRTTYTGGLHLTVIDLPSALTRDTVVVGDEVWREIDLGLTAVRDRHHLLNTHGLGARRGVLLCGPPGTGKSAVSAVIAAEVVGLFTVIYVEAKAGEHLLTAVVQEAQRLGGPVLLILEDVDLWCQSRLGGYGGGLSELLAAMGIAADARILTLASTNDAATLDEAAIRTGRFDSIVGIGYPTRTDAARILTALIAGLPGSDTVDAHAVAAAVPDQTSGSDLREIVRRAVLSADETGHLDTAALLAEVGSGRYRATIPNGMYL